MRENVDTELVRQLPKAELNIHLEGAIQSGTAVELARRNGVSLPEFDSVEDLYSFSDLGAFLQVYSAIAKSIVGVDDFRRITYEMLRDAARNGARYVEFFISPHAHEGIPFATQFEGIVRGIEDAETDFGVRSAFIPGMNRELGPAAGEEYLDEILANRSDRLIGLGLDYNEAPHPPEPFAAVFARARENGLHLSAHAGETGPAAFVEGSIDALKVERIDHGYNVLEDPALVERCRDMGIMFTCCPTTTVHTTSARDLTAPDHPIRRMKEAGLVVSINSDDPPMFMTNLGREYELAMNALEFSPSDIKNSILASIEHSWADADSKSRWREEWGAEIDRIFEASQNQSRQ